MIYRKYIRKFSKLGLEINFSCSYLVSHASVMAFPFLCVISNHTQSKGDALCN